MKHAPLDLILIGYRTADTQTALRFCEQAFDRSFSGRRILVLNRSDLLEQLDPPPQGWEVVAGSNDLAEFSAWQEGLAVLRGSRTNVAFVNDTVTTHRRFTAARRAALLKAMRSAGGAAMVGFTDRGIGSFAIAGYPLAEWVSTYCFMLTAEALERLGGKLYDPALVASVVPGGLDEDAFFAGLSSDLERRLRHEIFDGGWYGGGRLTSANAARLCLKARCIVAELLLSARGDGLGIERVDPFRHHPVAARIDRFQLRLQRYLARRLALR